MVMLSVMQSFLLFSLRKQIANIRGKDENAVHLTQCRFQLLTFH